MRGAVVPVFAALIGAAGPALADLGSTPRTSLSGFTAVMTDDGWEDVLYPNAGVNTRESYLFGATVSREWSLGDFGYMGVEGGLYRHVGVQDFWELAAPFYVRSQRPAHNYIPNLSFGLGLSYASSVPKIEVERKDESRRLLVMWFIELEFRSLARTRPYLRLHHRSDGYGLLDVDTGSNAVGIGLRRDF